MESAWAHFHQELETENRKDGTEIAELHTPQRHSEVTTNTNIHLERFSWVVIWVLLKRMTWNKTHFLTTDISSILYY